MINRELFSTNFKILRETYGLTLKGTANFLGLKSTGSIADWESQRILPSLDMLSNITDFFAVSADWLMGRSSIPYTEETVKYAEDALIAAFNQIGTQQTLPGFTGWDDLVDPGHLAGKTYEQGWLPKAYADYESRRNLYSLGKRANIVFLMRKGMLTMMSGNTQYSAKETAAMLLPNISLFREFKEAMKKQRMELWDKDGDPLEILLRDKHAPILFDLEKAIAEKCEK